METHSEPSRKKVSCPYCADAPINHGLFFFASLISLSLDNHIIKTTRHAPQFLRDFVDFIMLATFETFIFLGLATLSRDIEKAKTFRSKVAWLEAERRGIPMEQVIMCGKPLDQYRAIIHGKPVYFHSLPIPSNLLKMKKNWDDKFLLKKEFASNGIPVPQFFQFLVFNTYDFKNIFSKFKKPIIVKPRIGSRGRHTVTHINTFEEFREGINVAKEICAYVVAEEHLEGDVCRATFVGGKLMGFYRGSSPAVVGDGHRTVRELIEKKDKERRERVEKVLLNKELEDYISRLGFNLDSVLPLGKYLSLTYRTGRFFGGVTREMLDELHPSFVPILKKAAEIVDLPVIGFDIIISDPTQSADSQRWGIIECNTLPFIDLHYYALDGKPKNIAGAIWDMWDHP